LTHFGIVILLFISGSSDFNETMTKLNDENLSVVTGYKEIFETKFLKEAEDFYRQQEISYNDKESIITYFNQVTFAR
jgi:hypothetical protein